MNERTKKDLTVNDDDEGENQDRDAWQKQWLATRTGGPDTVALVQQAHRRSRREKIIAVLEILLGLAAIGNCLRAALAPGPSALERGFFLTLAILVVVLLVWAFRHRQRVWSQHIAAPSDAVRLERQRLNNQLRYWKFNMWCVLALWLLCLVMAALTSIVDAENATSWLFASAANLVCVLVTFFWRRGVMKRVKERQWRLNQIEHRF